MVSIVILGGCFTHSTYIGPISAIVHVDSQDESTLENIKQEYVETAELNHNVDLHLIRIPGEKLSVLFPRNAERNLARLLSRTDYIMDVPADMIPASDLRRTLEANKEKVKELLEAGDLLALPTFSFKDKDVQKEDIPIDKGQLINSLHEGKMVLDDKHWKENEGPTDLEKWVDASTLYAIDKYEFHYEPVVIESKIVQPWCSERFLDSRAACIFSSYLQGNEIYVMPDDYMIQMPDDRVPDVSDFDVSELMMISAHDVLMNYSVSWKIESMQSFIGSNVYITLDSWTH